MQAVIAVVAAYALGSIPFGVLVARSRSVDLQQAGSGNIGATNAARVLGKKLGLAVLACDVLKGWLPVKCAHHLGLSTDASGMWLAAAMGGAAVLGHVTCPWLGGRGGKGVATALGVFLAFSPLAALAAVATFVAVYALWRIASLGSLAGATVLVPALWLLGQGPSVIALGIFLWALIVLKHRDNLRRLLERTEFRL